MFLYITSSVKSPRALGSVRGISQTAGSLARALGPTMPTSLFAFTLQSYWLGRLGAYAALIAISLWGIPLTYNLPGGGGGYGNTSDEIPALDVAYTI